jgi:hypothetical protein
MLSRIVSKIIKTRHADKNGCIGVSREAYIRRLSAIPENLTASSMAGERAANIRYKDVMQSVVA